MVAESDLLHGDAIVHFHLLVAFGDHGRGTMRGGMRADGDLSASYMGEPVELRSLRNDWPLPGDMVFWVYHSGVVGRGLWVGYSEIQSLRCSSNTGINPILQRFGFLVHDGNQ